MAIVAASAHYARLIELSEFGSDDGGKRIDGGFELAVFNFLHFVQLVQVLIVSARLFLELGVLLVHKGAVVNRALIQ